MIFRWLLASCAWLLKLVIPPPKQPEYPPIDPNEQCPACGHREGFIQAVQNDKGKWIRHTCKVCKAWWLVKPVLQSRSELFAAKSE